MSITPHFNSLTHIAAHGNNSTYNYHYKPEIEEILYYRLKMIDMDGASAYSQVVSVDASCRMTDVKIFPTITTGKVTIYRNKYKSIQPAFIYNSRGCLIRTILLDEKVNDIDLLGEQAGIYYLRINLMNGEEFSSKIVKIN